MGGPRTIPFAFASSERGSLEAYATMTYRLFTVGILSLLLGSVAGASTPSAPDGSWWTTLGPNEKAAAIFVGSSSYAAGFAAGKLEYQQFYEEKEKRLEAPLPAPMKAKWNAFSDAFARYYQLRKAPAFGKTLGEYVATLDGYYVPHGSFNDVPVPYLFGCLEDAPRYTCAQLGRFWRKL